jgi:hypothetical protein
LIDLYWLHSLTIVTRTVVFHSLSGMFGHICDSTSQYILLTKFSIVNIIWGWLDKLSQLLLPIESSFSQDHWWSILRLHNLLWTCTMIICTVRLFKIRFWINWNWNWNWNWNIRGGQRLKILIEINRTIKIFNAAINF